MEFDPVGSKKNFIFFFFFSRPNLKLIKEQKNGLKIEFLFVTISQLRLKRKKRITPQGLFFKTKITTFLLPLLPKIKTNFIFKN
jgi:hypothetical protein